MKKNEVDRIAIVLFIIGIAGLYCTLQSCNAVKKVNKSEEKQLRVIQSYVKKHPVKNDTTYLFRPGVPVIEVQEKTDTVLVRSKDTVYATVYKTKTETRTLHDTTEMKTTDRKFEVALQKTIDEMNQELAKTYKILTEYKATVSELKHSLSIWKIRFFVLLGINTLFILWRIKKLFLL